MGLAGMLSLEERDRFASMPLADYMRYVFDHKPNDKDSLPEHRSLQAPKAAEAVEEVVPE